MRIDQDVMDGLVACNAPPEIIDAARRDVRSQESSGCEVWKDNWMVFMLFLDLSTQWLVSPAGSYLGINYASLESIMNIRNIRKSRRPALLRDIRFMEDISLSVLKDRK